MRAMQPQLGEQPDEDHLVTPRWAVAPPVDREPDSNRSPTKPTWDTWKTPVEGPQDVLNNTNGLR
jgi:hypothetical protein